VEEESPRLLGFSLRPNQQPQELELMEVKFLAVVPGVANLLLELEEPGRSAQQQNSLRSQRMWPVSLLVRLVCFSSSFQL